MQGVPGEIGISVCSSSTLKPFQSATIKVQTCFIWVVFLKHFSIRRGDVLFVNATKQEGVTRSLCVGQQSKSGQGSRGSLENRSGGEEFSLKELYAVQEIQSQPNLLRLIVQ